MIPSWHVSPGPSSPCHRLSVPNRLVCGSPTNWRARFLSRAAPHPGVGSWGGAPPPGPAARRERGRGGTRLAPVHGSGTGGPPAGEQAEGAPVGGVDLLGDLVEVGLG